jgi:hypothetical protein
MSPPATVGHSCAPARDPHAARAVAVEPGDCTFCGSGFRVGDELLVNEDERTAHYDCGRWVEGWS